MYQFSKRHSQPAHVKIESPRTENYLHVNIDRNEVEYIGPGNSDDHAYTILADHPVPKDCTVYYFEVKVIDKGDEGFIGVGLQQYQVNRQRLPGWDDHSYGYHGDDGNIFSGAGRGNPFGPQYTTGDVIGVLFNQIEKNITFIKNGLEIGVGFRGVNEKDLYPCVGLRTQHEKVRINFGSEPFIADFQTIQENVKQQALNRLSQQQNQNQFQGSQILLGNWVLDYLIFNGHFKTAQIVAQDHLGKQQPLSQEQNHQQNRHKITESIKQRKIDEAIELINKGFPEFFTRHPQLQFKLKFMKLLNIIYEGKGNWALAAVNFAKNDLQECFDQDENQSMVQDALVMLAYEDPKSSPQGKRWLKEERLKECAQEVNVALVQEGGGGCCCMLDTLVGQCQLVHKQLMECDNLNAQVLNLNQAIESATSQNSDQPQPLSQQDLDKSRTSNSKHSHCTII